MNKVTRVIFMGTPEFAVPSLRALVHAGYEVVGVVTQPDRPVGRKRILQASPVKVAAVELGLLVLQPERARSEESVEALRVLKPDVCVTAAYGQILPQSILDIPAHGCLNIHASLLPRWRGAAPIHRAIMAGDATTGITLMKMVKALDAGPMLAKHEEAILAEDNLSRVHDRLAEAGAKLLLDVLPQYLQGDIVPVAQSEEGVSYAERIVREDEYVNWSLSMMAVYNHIRGLSPWPGATTMYGQSSMKIWAAHLSDSLVAGGGGVGAVFLANGQVRVQCGDGSIILDEVQPAGKRKMPAIEWFRGLQTGMVRFDSIGGTV